MKKQTIISAIIMAILLVIIGVLLYKLKVVNETPVITVKDSIERKVQIIDSIRYEVVQRDSIIIKLNKQQEDEIEKAISADDSATVELFYKLLSE